MSHSHLDFAEVHARPMRSGTIELGSGRWHWTLLPQWTGATVIFQHRDRVHDEMRSWTTETELTEEDARELALDALERVWVDSDGLKWRLSVELPSDWRHRENETGEGDDAALLLVFKRGGLRRVVGLPETSRLGEIPHGELRALLEQAYTSSSNFLG